MRIPLLVLCTLAPATIAMAQGVSPVDQREAARFGAVRQAATRAGYANIVVVGHGEGAHDALFALTATRGDSGALVVVAQRGGRTVRPVELERAATPAALGLRGIDFDTFLGDSSLVDVGVTHEPFMLETSRRFATHHLVRQTAAGLSAVCEFPGEASSSTSKGIGSMRSDRRITVERLAGTGDLRFSDREVNQTTESSRGAAPVTTVQSDSTRAYILPATGMCRRT